MSSTFLSRGIDYLGDLGAKLRDLQGYRTLAHELIQNADDVPNSTTMSFDVSEDALVVDNDGVFSDCQRIDTTECQWKEDSTHGHRCDFHRFRRIASGDKRQEPGTTGAFGIGFVAVYQITDCPELISAGRHWILHEDEAEARRIEVCGGCPGCTAQDVPGTRFIFPWVRDQNSPLRQALRADSVAPEGAQRMLDELKGSLQIATLFLKRLKIVELKWSGQIVSRFLRLDENDQVVLSDGDSKHDRSWHLIRGEFKVSANALRERHHGRIEAKRSPEVTVAIPLLGAQEGLLCACLPTEHNIGLPFHLNADFFPTNDRKRVIFAEDYQSEWNRAAVQASADAIATSFKLLPTLLGAERFWEFLLRLKAVSDGAVKGIGESSLAAFWKSVEPCLRTEQIVYTADERWTTSAEATVLFQSEEASAIPVLQALGLRVAHETLRPYQSLLRAVGVRLVNIDILCKALLAHGFSQKVPRSELPAGLRTAVDLAGLWREIDLLLERQQHTPKARAEDEQRLRLVAIAPGRDGALHRCDQIYWAEDSTVKLFEPLQFGIVFASSDEAFYGLVHLCRVFDASAAVEIMRVAGGERLQHLWQENSLPLKELFAWLENRRQDILNNNETLNKLVALTLFPSSTKLCKLSELALPGKFEDPLGLADLVDVDSLGGRREFLIDIGMSELDFRTYAVKRLPLALKNPAVAAEKRRAAIVLLADHIGEISDDQEAQHQLAASPLVGCVDGEFREANQCYFDGREVRDCLGGELHFAVLPVGHENAVRHFYRWLGVATEPRFSDIALRVRQLSSQPYSYAAVVQVQKIISYLGKKIEKGDSPADLRFLSTYQWLPAKGKSDRWYRPTELYAIYQAHLFDSQALFLDASKNIQDASSAFLEFIRVSMTPPVALVVKHLLHCADIGQAANVGIYQFLNNNAGDPAVAQLRRRYCLWFGNAYRTPEQVFWGQHPFGQYRWRLPEELRSASALLQQLHVRDTPDYEDALAVLREISEQFGKTNSALNDEALAVLMKCWEILENAFLAGILPPNKLTELRSLKCVPNAKRVLDRPEWMFFENRAGLSAKFGNFLTNNVISRPLGCGGAFAAAGVRPLGSAVRTELLECLDPKDSPDVTQRIRNRKNEIGRVLESQVSSRESLDALSTLDQIRCHTSAKMVVRFRLSVFNRDLDSTPEHVPALFQREHGVLLFTPREGQHPWSAIARELSVALFPDEDPGRFAAGLKEVLAPESASEAATVLDELGFARLDTTVHKPPTPGEATGSLGTEASPAETIPPSSSNEVDSPNEPSALSAEDAIKNLLGLNAEPPSPPVPDAMIGDSPTSGQGGASGQGGSGGQSETGGQSGAGDGKGSTAKSKRPVLRSYIPSPDADNSASGDSDDDDEAGRSPIDIAGVRHVLEYELNCERIPTEMPHKNPGFDVESRNGSGQIVRYIEVKSFSGKWSDTFADLSRTQFHKASGLGDLFWLYVVERADTEEFQIYRIQNPALKANHFMFDDGWRATAERDMSAKKGS